MEGVVNPDPKFWRGRRVLITGHTGFKGAWLSLWLSHLGADVTGFSLPDAPSAPSLHEIACAGKITHITGDLRNQNDIIAAVKTASPDIIFHLAAQSLVRESYDDPVGTYATNVMGTLHLFEAARAASNVRAVINVTSDKCYENKNWDWAYRENEPMGGHDPYSSSKGCAELLTSSYRRSYLSDGHSFALASVRAGNVIGGGDWAKDRIVPDCIRAFIADTPVVIRNPLATRPWQHVLDPLCGYIAVAEKLCAGGGESDFAQGWNFGPTDADAKNVNYIVNTLITLWGDTARFELDKNAHPHEAKYLKVDSSKAKKSLGWTHRLPVYDALKWTSDWYSAHHNGADPFALCLEQIKAYTAINI